MRRSKHTVTVMIDEDANTIAIHFADSSIKVAEDQPFYSAEGDVTGTVAFDRDGALLEIQLLDISHLPKDWKKDC